MLVYLRVLVHFDQASAIFETWRGLEREERASRGMNSEADLRCLHLLFLTEHGSEYPLLQANTNNSCALRK